MEACGQEHRVQHVYLSIAAMFAESKRPFYAIQQLPMFHKCSNGCDNEAQKLKFMIEYEFV